MPSRKKLKGSDDDEDVNMKEEKKETEKKVDRTKKTATREREARWV